MTGIYNAIEVKVLDQFQPCRSKTGANNHKRGITCQMSMPDDNVIVKGSQHVGSCSSWLPCSAGCRRSDCQHSAG